MIQFRHMPPEGETEVVLEKPKRASRKRVAKVDQADTDTSAPIKRAPRKRAPKKMAKGDEPMAAAHEQTLKRKAPTPIADQLAQQKHKRRQLLIVSVMIIIGVGASAAVGVTDKGAINVEETIAYRNEQAQSSGTPRVVLPVQNSPTQADGGLIGLGIGGPEGNTASSTPVTETATTTDESVSSTEPAGQAPLTAAEAEAAAQTASMDVTEVPTQ